MQYPIPYIAPRHVSVLTDMLWAISHGAVLHLYRDPSSSHFSSHSCMTFHFQKKRQLTHIPRSLYMRTRPQSEHKALHKQPSKLFTPLEFSGTLVTSIQSRYWHVRPLPKLPVHRSATGCISTISYQGSPCTYSKT